MSKSDRIYGIRIHDRLQDSDPSIATVMYSISGPEGPWHDIATCATDWAWEVLDALLLEQSCIVKETKADAELIERIENLEKTISELVPYMVLDAYNGLFLEPTDDHDDACQDCNWYKESKRWETRIRSGEFGIKAVELLDQLQNKFKNGA